MYIEGIGDEVFNFFVILLTFIIVYVGWQSTRVSEPPVNVLIIDNRRSSPVPNTISELTDAVRSESQLSNRTEELEIVNDVISDLENDISDFVNGSETSAEENGAEESIIQRMDQPDGDVEPPQVVKEEASVEPEGLRRRAVPDSDRPMTIKLKYLNEDLKMVNATSTESIGEFKKRHFSVELAAQKLVRLVFNGHVLQPDKKTLEECQLFDGCVVHALVHNQKPNQSTHHPSSQPSTTTSGDRQETTPNAQQTGAQGGLDGARAGSNNNNNAESFLNNRPETGRLYLYIGMIFISFTLLFCWFCRFQYSYLFSFYSTVGLILMSVLFVAMIPLIILIERDVVG